MSRRADHAAKIIAAVAPAAARLVAAG